MARSLRSALFLLVLLLLGCRTIGGEHRVVAAERELISGQRDRITQPAEMAGATSIVVRAPTLSQLTEVQNSYTVQGRAVSNPAYGTVGVTILECVIVSYPNDTSLFTPIDDHSSWDAIGTLRIKRLAAPEDLY